MTEIDLKTITGRISGISNEVYHSLPHLSSTGLNRFISRSPAHYRQSIKEKTEPTAAMAFGTAVHTAILEPELFDKQYVVRPAGLLFTTKEGKAWRDANSDRTILTSDEMQKIEDIRESVMTHPTAAKFFQGGSTEESFFWQDEKTGVLCRARPDYFLNDTIIDLKTTEDASDRAFQSSMMKFGYHIQTAFYLRGLSQVLGTPLTDFVHVAVEKTPPYALACYVLDDATIERANEIIDRALDEFAACQAKDIWPGYTTELIATNLPHWAY